VQSDIADPAAEQRSERRSRALETLNQLHAQRTVLIDRVKLVVAEFEAKGGDKKKVELHSKYITAVSGVKVDVSDAQAAWVTIYGWLTSAEGGIRWIKNISMFIFIVIGFFVLAKMLAKALLKALEASARAPELLKNFLVSGIRRLVIIIGIIVGLAALEVNIGPLMAVIGAAGFVIAFALQDSLSNFASGILILLYHPFDVGDVVEAGGVSGSVNSVNLLFTHIRTFDNKLMIVPNNDIWGGVITNATGTDKRRVDMVFGIGYADDIDKVQQILEEIVSVHALVLKDPQPVVCVHELADSSVNFICRPWTRTADYWTVYWDVTRSVKQRFDEQGISIPFPQRDVHVYNETSR
jgi:small conductance mechanosensitive channel